MQYILLSIVIGGLFFVIIFLWKVLGDTTPVEKLQAFGKITRLVFTDGGNVRYYIQLDLGNGNIVEGKSITYANTKNKYHEEDIVPVYYFFTKNKQVMFEINDSDLISCANAYRYKFKFLKSFLNK